MPMPGSAQSAFLTDVPVDIVVRVHRGRCEIDRNQPILKSHSMWWQVYQQYDGFAFTVAALESGPHLERLLLTNRSFTQADLFLDEQRADDDGDPLEYPLDKILFASILSLRQGVIVHATAVVVDGGALLFIGDSGAGKSTMARLWSAERDVTVLADDLIILRYEEGRFIAYGTPWRGGPGLSSPTSAPLARIYLIYHSKTNQLAPLPAGARLAARLFNHSYPPYWLKEGLAAHVGLIERLALTIPCFELGFLPDPSVISYVRATCGNDP